MIFHEMKYNKYEQNVWKTQKNMRRHFQMSKNNGQNVRKFGMRDKLGYTLGDLGCCCSEQFRAMYLSVFYTLILRVNPFHVGS